jgi:ribulose-phosphate 3-epimerase
VALNPSTPVTDLSELTADIDLALCMTVNPGWGGQRFLPGSLSKLERLRSLIGDRPALEVDGGIDAATAGPCAAAGATVFVAGSAIFGATDPADAYNTLAATIGT